MIYKVIAFPKLSIYFIIVICPGFYKALNWYIVLLGKDHFYNKQELSLWIYINPIILGLKWEI